MSFQLMPVGDNRFNGKQNIGDADVVVTVVAEAGEDLMVVGLSDAVVDDVPAGHEIHTVWV